MRGIRIGVLMAFFCAGCSNNEQDELPLGSYDNGIFVVNEGNAQTGTITYISDNLSLVQQDIFSVVNPQQNLGGYVQSLFFAEDKAYIISNFANQITIVNRYTLAYLGSISTGLYNPRYGVVYNGKAYVTNMASFETEADDYLAVVDLTTLALESPIMIGDYAERICEEDGKIVVSNGAFGSGTAMTIIDADTGSLQQVDIGVSPNSFTIEEGMIYIMGSTSAGASSLIKMPLLLPSQFQVVPLPGELPFAGNLTEENGLLYFMSGGKVFKTPLAAAQINTTPLIDTQSTSSYIGYGFAVEDDRIFVCEATEDFTSDGTLLVYSTTGQFIQAVPVGLGPNSVYFN